MMGITAYYANRQLFNSSLISRSSSSKLQVYDTLVRPVVTYGSESWTLTMEEERALAVFERKILRKIYGPVKENEMWRITQNDELEDIKKEYCRFKKFDGLVMYKECKTPQFQKRWCMESYMPQDEEEDQK